MVSVMRVKVIGNTRIFTFNGNIEKQIKRAEKEIERLSKDLPMYGLIYEKAYKEYITKKNRLRNLEDFVKFCLERLKESEEGEQNETI